MVNHMEIDTALYGNRQINVIKLVDELYRSEK